MEKKKRRRIQLMCAVSGLILYGAAASGMGWGEQRILDRNSHGEGTAFYKVAVDGLLDQETEMEIPVRERSYTREEAEEIFDRIGTELPEQIRGENPSLEQVGTDLNLIGSRDDWGVDIRWETDGRLVDGFGKIYGEKAAPEGEKTVLKAILSDGTYEKAYEFELTVFPPRLTGEERTVMEFLEQVDQEDREQGGEKLILPETFRGRELSYRDPDGNPLWALPFFGIAAAAFLEVEDREKKRREKEKREQELLRDYPEVLSKLTVFLGAGLTVRGAWEQVVRGYEQGRKEGGKERYAYEEMKTALGQIEKKVPEGRAYQEFGRRCGLRPYMKLAGLLEQNRREGAKNLRGAMRTEMASAFEERKNLARKRGEEAGTKLLLPLFLMLGVVMAMVAAPALLAF